MKPARVIRDFNEGIGKWTFVPQFKDNLVYAEWGEDEYSWRKSDTWFHTLEEAVSFIEEFRKYKDGEVVYEDKN